MVTVPFFSELTPEQQKTLIDIRRRKTELLLEIQVSDSHRIAWLHSPDNLIITVYLTMSKQWTVRNRVARSYV